MADPDSLDTLRRPQKLVVCCDGTWMNSDTGWVPGKWYNPFDQGHLQTPSNVTRIARALAPVNKDGQRQIVYYQAGVGSSSWSITNRLFGGGVGAGLSENVREAYGFLVNNYITGTGDNPEEKDEIYLLGFSRGAYTARSIGGMLGGLGLLKKEYMGHFYQIFEDWENAGTEDYEPKLPQADGMENFKLKVSPKEIGPYVAAYKEELLRLKMTREVTITAMGVWDTVGSLGVPVATWLQWIPGIQPYLRKYRFFDTGLGEHVKNAFQALALDEERNAFSPTVWDAHGSSTKLNQVWFPGVHSNVGGSYEDTSIANITLAWMMDQFSPFLTFRPTYLPSQIQSREHFLADAKRRGLKLPAKAPIWGLGKLYDSTRLFYKLMGTKTRTPASYEVTNYQTGRATGVLLKKTNESVHPCVRIRYDYGGTTNDDKTKYTSKALKQWSWEKESGKWVWTGATQKEGMKTELGESVLRKNGFEEELLMKETAKDEDVLEAVLKTPSSNGVGEETVAAKGV